MGPGDGTLGPDGSAERLELRAGDLQMSGGPGVDEVRWLKPVRPGDTLRARFTVTDARPSSRRPDRGVVRSLSEVFNQHGELVMTLRGLGMFARRPA